MLNSKSTYAQIKSCFFEHFGPEKEALPKTLDGQGKYYTDVKFTFDYYTNQIDQEIKKHGKKINRSAIAAAAKANLLKLWKDLQYKKGWNVPMAKTVGEKTKRRNDRAKS